jgi:hypothetical protein
VAIQAFHIHRIEPLFRPTDSHSLPQILSSSRSWQAAKRMQRMQSRRLVSWLPRL